jgi:multimeric flavodoxin WrbA
MNIITLLGSPRQRGNTATVLRAFDELMQPQHHVERINIVDHDVRGCLGCDACQKVTDEPGCVQKDDAPAILRRLMDADLIVYASPVYCWAFSAQMKALLDRHYCMVKWCDGQQTGALMRGKRTMLLATCGGGVAAEEADLMQKMFEREMRYLEAEVVGQYVVAGCTKPAELGDRARITAQRMTENLGA